MILLPITQAIFVIAAIAGTIIGGAFLYSMGDLSFGTGDSFPTVHLSTGLIIMIAFCLFGGLWTMFYFNGCNKFIMSSAVSIWFFNSPSMGDENSPFCDSLGRLVRFHSGSVAIVSLIHGILFALKVLCNIFSFSSQDDDNGLVKACLTCLNFIFCIFKMYTLYYLDFYDF